MSYEDCVTLEEIEVMDEYYSHPISPIEYLGYAKNDIVNAQIRMKKMVSFGLMPRTIENKLKEAYAIIDEAQEELYLA